MYPHPHVPLCWPDFGPWGPNQRLGLLWTFHGWTRISTLFEVNPNLSKLLFDPEATTDQTRPFPKKPLHYYNYFLFLYLYVCTLPVYLSLAKVGLIMYILWLNPNVNSFWGQTKVYTFRPWGHNRPDLPLKKLSTAHRYNYLCICILYNCTYSTRLFEWVYPFIRDLKE